MTIFWRQKKPQNRRLTEKTADKSSSSWSVSRILGTATVGLLVTGGVGAIWWKLTDPSVLPMRQVQLEAPFVHVTKEELHKVIASNAVGGFFNIDVDAVTDAVEALPWVASVTARRVWPDTLHVTVHEQKAVARWRDNALVNKQGELFYPDVDSFPAGLTELYGPDATINLMTTKLVEFREALQGLGLSLQRIELMPRRAWAMKLSNNMVVTLGRENVNHRLQRFTRFYPQLSAMNGEIKRMDMRYTNGFSVQWQQMPAA